MNTDNLQVKENPCGKDDCHIADQVVMGTIIKITEMSLYMPSQNDDSGLGEIVGKALALDGFFDQFEVELQFVLEEFAAQELLALAVPGAIIAARGIYSIARASDGGVSLHSPTLTPIHQSSMGSLRNLFNLSTQH